MQSVQLFSVRGCFLGFIMLLSGYGPGEEREGEKAEQECRKGPHTRRKKHGRQPPFDRGGLSVEEEAGGEARRCNKMISAVMATANVTKNAPMKARRLTGRKTITRASNASTTIILATIPPKTIAMNAPCGLLRATLYNRKLAAAFVNPRATPRTTLVQMAASIRVRE